MRSMFINLTRCLYRQIENCTNRYLPILAPPTRTMSSNSNLNSLVAICHMRSTHDKLANREQIKEIVKRSKEKAASFLFLPECCDYVGRDVQETISLSEPIEGGAAETVKFYKQLAKDNNLWMSIGGFHEASTTEKDKISNSHLIINANGELLTESVYRKLHLFDVNTPEFKFRESKVVVGGSKIIRPLLTPIGQLGLMICYDLRFPELSTILFKQGAQILTYPSAFAQSTGLAHWEIMLRARAIESQCFVIASAQIGYHNEKRQSYGHAMVVDPWGKILAECDSSKDLDVAVAEIDLNRMQKVRQNMPCQSHRRNDVYSLGSLEIWPKPKTDEFIFEKYPIPESTIFYESEHSLAFTNIRCVVPGHVLVATRRPAKRLKDLSNDEIVDFFQTVCKIQKLTEQFYQTTSSTVTVQDGRHAGQTVSHVHCHVMPRREGDFRQNDEIYIELNKMDADNNEETRRSLDEMSAEADGYRQLLRTD